MSSYSIVLAPIAAMMAVDFFFVKKRKYDIYELYRPDGSELLQEVSRMPLLSPPSLPIRQGVELARIRGARRGGGCELARHDQRNQPLGSSSC
jgi:hypothetical protein